GCSVRTPRGPGPSTCRTGAPSAAHSPRAPVTTRARSAIPRSRAPSTTASTGPRRRPRPPSAGTSNELSSPGCAPPSTSPPTPRAGPLGRSEDAADPDRRTAAPGSPDALPVRELLEQTVVGIVLGTEPALAGPAARSGEDRVLTRPLHHQGDDHDQHGQLSADQRHHPGGLLRPVQVAPRHIEILVVGAGDEAVGGRDQHGEEGVERHGREQIAEPADVRERA